MDRIVSLGGWTGAPLALGRTGGAWLLMEKQNGKWNQTSMPPAMQSVFRPLVIPSTNGVAILTEHTLFHRIDGHRWLQFSLPELPELKLQCIPEKWGVQQRLFNAELFVAWNRGEFGGMILKFDLLSQEKGWQKALDVPVTGMSVDKQGRLWISGGESMTSFRYLSIYNGTDWKEVVCGEFKKSEAGATVLPGTETYISGSTTSKDGTLYILTGSLGVLTFGDGKFKPVLNFDFNGVWKGNIGCGPDRLPVDDTGNLFVHSNSFDVFCFLKRKNRYRFLQVIAPRVDTPGPTEKAKDFQRWGDGQLRMKEFEKAISYYTQALSETSSYVDALEGRAAAREALGEVEEARKDREAACGSRTKGHRRARRGESPSNPPSC